MRVLIIGAGGHGRVVADILFAAEAAGGSITPAGFIDDRAEAGSVVMGLPVLGPVPLLAQFPHDGVIVAIGDNAIRRRISESLVAAGETLARACHPAAVIARDVTVGAGSMISAGAIVTPGTTIGRGVIVNTKASVDHDCVVGDFAHISCGATLGGACIVGEDSMIGLGACISNGCAIGSRSIVGAGAVVVRDIPDDVVAYGVPARVMRDRRLELAIG